MFNNTTALVGIAAVASLAAGCSLWFLIDSISMHGYPPLTMIVDYNSGYLAAFILVMVLGTYISIKLLIKNTLKTVALLNLLWLSLCCSILAAVAFRYFNIYWHYF